MATKKYNTMHQHEPLSVPRKWSGEEIRFATQLEETLDDLYRIINRLKLSDLAGDLKLTDKDGNETIAISAGGDITAKSISADNVIVGGKTLSTIIAEKITGQVIVSEEQPDAHGVVWIKPTTGSGQGGEVMEEATYSGTPSINMNGSRIDFVVNLTNKVGSITSDECKYHAAIRVNNTKGRRKLTSIQFGLTGWDKNDQPTYVALASIKLDTLVNPGDYFVIDSEAAGQSQDYTNITYDDSIMMIVHLEFSDSGTISVTEDATVRAYALKEDQSGDAVKTCEVYYLS